MNEEDMALMEWVWMGIDVLRTLFGAVTEWETRYMDLECEHEAARQLIIEGEEYEWEEIELDEADTSAGEDWLGHS